MAAKGPEVLDRPHSFDPITLVALFLGSDTQTKTTLLAKVFICEDRGVVFSPCSTCYVIGALYNYRAGI